MALQTTQRILVVSNITCGENKIRILVLAVLVVWRHYYPNYSKCNWWRLHGFLCYEDGIAVIFILLPRPLMK